MNDAPFAGSDSAPVLFDLDPDQLADYAPTVAEPADFDRFWKELLDESRTRPPALDWDHVSTPLRSVVVQDVTFGGYRGQPVRGWLMLPADAPATGSLPLVIQYVGYGDGRGLPAEHLLWASAGYAHFVMDSRGQGSLTPDNHPRPPGAPDGAHVLRGVDDPHGYYYGRLIVDAVHAVDCLAWHPAIDPDRIVVAGTSQGGGLALAAAALSDAITALLCDIPFLCHWRRASQLADRGPYTEIARYCATGVGDIETVFHTLSYFDGVSFASRADVPALFSVALMDRVCPPSTVYAAYNRYAGPKEIAVWEFNGHEGGGLRQNLRQLDFLDRVLGRSR
jgi:cephalosporin-C deacetylase